MSKSPGSHINPFLKGKKKPGWMQPGEWVTRIRQGDKVALSAAITLVESSRPADRKLAAALFELLGPESPQSIRIGVTGIPGAGKSTFIEAIGKEFMAQGKKIAVLAIDPSSKLSGGSILGDKTRMEELSRAEAAFIRPTPSGGTLGGVARHTRETIALCEAAGFDLVMIETVGVGQSEVEVHSLSDIFVLLVIPGAGDELQGIKRGIMEMADLVVVNKAEGDNAEKAALAVKQLENAIHLFPPNPSGHAVQVMKCSSLKGDGIPAIAKKLLETDKVFVNSGAKSAKRREQSLSWFHKTVSQSLEDLFFQHSGVKTRLSTLQEEVKAGAKNPFQAAELLLDAFKKDIRL